jgi:hypothetical protein
MSSPEVPVLYSQVHAAAKKDMIHMCTSSSSSSSSYSSFFLYAP